MISFDPKNQKFIDHTDVIRKLIAKALAEWSGSSKLTFEEINSMDADIILSFVTRKHGDNNDFDGYGGTLAHAWPPAANIGGDVHFDEDEAWNFEETGNFYPIVLHELGHAFGLGHSNGENDIMFEFYTRGTLTLSRDDVQGIQHIYGKPARTVNETETTENPITSELIPKACATNYDAIAILRKELVIFKGRYMFRFLNGKVMDGYPVLINRFWRDLPQSFTHIDAAFELNDNKILFFIGRDVYVFATATLDRKMSLIDLGISRFVDKIDAIFTWGYNNKTYIISGELYWRQVDFNFKAGFYFLILLLFRFDQETFSVDKHYPLKTSDSWRYVYDIDTAFSTNGTIYFFKDKSFYSFDNRAMRLRIMKPQSSAQHWMGCPPDEDRIIFDNRFQSADAIDTIIDVDEEIFEDDIENVEKYADYVEIKTTSKASTMNIKSYPIILISIILLSSR